MEKYELILSLVTQETVTFTSMMIRDTTEDRAKAEEAVEELFSRTVSLGGTLSGEHGIGLAKAPYVHMELSDQAIETMKKIKQLFDPNNILNPGKIFPT
jgi:glycolate oxidase